jgi:predicted Ser/Thr protein kinase
VDTLPPPSDSSPSPPAPASPAAGSLGPYRVLGELARGGMGVVYRAHDPRVGRDVAIKLLHMRGASREQRERFQREAEALGRLQHENVVPVHDRGEHDGLPYLVMSLIEGESLDARIEREGPLPVEEAARIAGELARALDYAHDQGILHRDLKPSNVLLAGGRPLLVDFGLAKLTDVSASGLSQTGQCMGTPGYLSPEQVHGAAAGLGPHTDVYGLGAVLYNMLTARPPLEGTTIYELLAAALDRPPISPREQRPEVPLALEAICLQCLEKDPQRRYPTAGALADDLARWQAGHAVEARGRGRQPKRGLLIAGLGVTAVCAAIGLGLVLTRPPVDEASPAVGSARPGQDAVVPDEDPSLPALVELVAQAERGELDRAQRGLAVFHERRGGAPALSPEARSLLLEARAHVIRQAGYRLDALDADAGADTPDRELRACLELIANLGRELEPVSGPWLEGEPDPSGPALARDTLGHLLERVRALGDDGPQVDRALRLLMALAHSGLRPSSRVSARRLIEVASFSRVTLGDDRLWWVLLAVTLLDVSFHNAEGASLHSEPPWGAASEDPYQELVELRVALYRDREREDERSDLRVRLWELVGSCPGLGPICTAKIVEQVGSVIPSDQKLTTLRVCAARAPEDPLPYAHLARELPKAGLPEEAADAADRALVLLPDSDLLEHSSSRSEVRTVMRGVLRGLVLGGQDARAEEAFEMFANWEHTFPDDAESIRHHLDSLRREAAER